MMMYSFLVNSVNVTFFGDEMDILSVDLNNINLDDIDFYKDGLETIIPIRLMALRKALKKRKQRINACRIASNKMLRLVYARL